MKFSEVLLAFITRVYGPKAARAAKAVLPATATVIAVIGQRLATGSFDTAELATALTGLGGAALTWIIPNLTKLAETQIKAGVPVSEAVANTTSDTPQTEYRNEGTTQPHPEDWSEADELSDVPDPPTDLEIREAGRA